MKRVICCRSLPGRWKTGLLCFLRSSSEKEQKVSEKEILKLYLKRLKESRENGAICEIFSRREGLVIAPALFLPLAETASHVSACPGYRRAPQQKRRLCNHWYRLTFSLSYLS